MSPRIPIAGDWGARRLGRAEGTIREVQQQGPGQLVYIGDWPSETLTTYWSPPWENGFESVSGYRVAFRQGFDGRLEFSGRIDAENAAPGTVAFTLPPDWRGEPRNEPVMVHLGDGEYIVGRLTVDADTGEVTPRWAGRGHFECKLFADRNALDGNLPDTAIVVSTGDGKFVIDPIPEDLDGTQLVHAAAGVSAPGAVTVQLRNITQSNLDLLSTRITIDSGEYSSYTAATPPVIIASQPVATGDRIAIDVDAASGAPEGLSVVLRFAARD